MQLAEPVSYTNCNCIMLVLYSDDVVGTVPMNNRMAFHSDDPGQLAQWLLRKRGPTCPNDVALVDAVRAEIDEVLNGETSTVRR